MKWHNFDAQSKKDVSKTFMMIRLKYFHDNLNIVVILAPGCEFFTARGVQFPVTIMEWN